MMPRVCACLLLLLVCGLCLPPPAHAYLDPGTGNILIYVVISLVTTALYFVKTAWYGLQSRLTGRGKPDAEPAAANGRETLVIFSEGKIYWSTFKHIVEALIEKKFPFRYISMDVEDPGLTVESPYMNSRYIGTGSAAFARAANERAAVMLQTTANIGTPGYPMPAPQHIKCLAHVLHGVGGLSLYYKYAHDTCDALLLMGDGDRESVRLLEKKRGLKERECVSAGVPSLDDLARKIKPKNGLSDPPVVLVAPSWGEKNCLAYCGSDFIAWLAEAGHTVIIRPHPFSLKVEAELVEGIRQNLAAYPNVRFDLEVDASASLAAADLMISDKSGVRFDFAFLYERPVLTLDIPMKNRENFEISELEYVWENDIEAQLGPVLSVEELRALDKEAFLALAREALRVDSAKLATLRDATVANFGSAGEFIATWAVNKCRERA